MRSVLWSLVAISVGLAAPALWSQTTISRAYVTTDSYPVNFGGLAGADSICQARASAFGYNGTWKGWLSTTTSSPSTRFVRATGAYKRLDGVLIANNWTDLTDGTLNAPINITPSLQVADPQTPYTWSNTTSGGAIDPQGDACFNWTDFTSDALLGNAHLATTAWTKAGTIPLGCGGSYRLYCFQDPVPSLAALSGRITTTAGRGIRHAKVTVTGSSLTAPREVFTVGDGFYTISNLPANTKYTVSVSQRRFTFAAARVVDVAVSISNFNFTSNQ